MSITVFLSNSKIQIVSGTSGKNSANVQQYYEMTAPEGSILNGVVTDAVSLSNAIRNFWHENRLPNSDVRLCINSQQFIVKLLEIPKLGRNKSVDYVKREFADVERAQDPVIGFFRVGVNEKNKTDVICAELAEYEFLDTYKKIFAEAGISIQGISSAVGSAVNMLQKSQYIKESTSVVLILDDKTLTSIFFVDGRYYYSSSTRIFNEYGTDSFGSDVSAVVSRLIQFANAQQITSRITDVYLGGFQQGDLEICSREIGLVDASIRTSELVPPANMFIGTATKFREMVYPAAGLYRHENEHNIIDGLNRKTNQQVRQKELLKKAIPFIAVTGVMAAILAALIIVNASKNSYADSLNQQLTDPVLVQNAADYNTEEAKSSDLKIKSSALSALSTNIHSYPYPNSKVVQVINDCASGLASVEVESYEASTGLLVVRTTSLQGGTMDDQVKVINEFIAKLMQNDTFTDVNYTGYNYDDQSQLYNINVNCCLSENAGKEGSGS